MPQYIMAVERACWILGCALTALYFAARTDAAVNGAADSARVTYDAALAVPSRAVDQPPTSALPLGVLKIPSLRLRTALYPDTRERYLNRGAGLISRMAQPGQVGNLGVAAHRDGTFKPLENIAVGAAIELQTASYRYVYYVTSIDVVDREDAALLRHTRESVITLVTCYPFRFVGRAPKRFVVRGLLGSIRETTALAAPLPRENSASI